MRRDATTPPSAGRDQEQPGRDGTPPAERVVISATNGWKVSRLGTQLRVFFGREPHRPQYAVLHLDSSYFRLTCGPPCGWGTSVVFLPVVWSGGLHQGGAVTAEVRLDEPDLVLDIAGAIASLTMSSEVRLSPPSASRVVARVTTEIQGQASLDALPGEAFKPVFLSSMHVSPDLWDTEAAYAEGRRWPLPSDGWIVEPPVTARVFGLQGGSSQWKPNAPTVEIGLSRPLLVGGWVTPSEDPNDDNVGLWAGTDAVLTSWSFSITAAPAPGSRTGG
jgi:hypothetical protein